MFARKFKIEWLSDSGELELCPVKWIDNFAMRNFTNDAVFDDTLPAGDGRLEAGYRVPADRLHSAMDDWFRRKGFLKSGDLLQITELPS